MCLTKNEAPGALAALTVDGDGIVTAVSTPALEMLSADAEDLIGKPCTDILRDKRSDAVQVEQSALLHTESGKTARLLVLGPCDRSPLQPDDQEAVLRLAAGMAHDFDNLLAIISGHLQMAESRADHAALRDHIRQSMLACAMGARMTRRLRTFARRQPLDARPYDINALVETVAEALDQILKRHRTFAVDLEPGIPLVAVDRSEFENALLNLLLNAIDATPNGGTITVKTRREGDAGDHSSGRATLTVSDSGIGMPAHVAQRAFEPFFSTKPPDQGTGLGLATVAGFVRQSGGTVQLSTRVGIGTSITMHFPLHPDDREPR